MLNHQWIFFKIVINALPKLVSNIQAFDKEIVNVYDKTKRNEVLDYIRDVILPGDHHNQNYFTE